MNIFLSFVLILSFYLPATQLQAATMNTPIQKLQHTEPVHKHKWDDLRILPVTIIEINEHTIRWQYTEERLIRNGYWLLDDRLAQSLKTRKVKLKVGQEFIGIYCSECQTVISLYNL